MGVRIIDDEMSGDTTPHRATLVREQGHWRVSWSPLALYDRNSAISAMNLAEYIAAYGPESNRSLIRAVAAKLGTSADEAVAAIQQAPESRPTGTHGSDSTDPITAMLDAGDNATRQALLPEAVRQVDKLAEWMCASIIPRATSTDPDVVRRVKQMRDSLAVHDQFSARWAGNMVDDVSWPVLAADLHQLLTEWAHVIDTVMPKEAK